MQACPPNLVADGDCLEQIQPLATRLVKCFHRLRRLGLHYLNRCRLRGDLIAEYNVFPGGLDLDPSFYIPSVRQGWSGHPFKIWQGRSRRLRRKSTFSMRVVQFWNRLFTSILTASAVNSFKGQPDSAQEDFFSEAP